MYIKRLLPKKARRLIALAVVAAAVLLVHFNSATEEEKHPAEPIEDLVVRFVDVGQGDCEILQFADGRNFIIDGGKNDSADYLVEKIKSYGIEKFDAVIATHPHEDHIGGLDKVIDNFEIGCVYMPDAVSGSKTFEDMLDSIENKNVQVQKAKAGVYVIDEEKISMMFVAPNSNTYEETNDYSAVVKLDYNGFSFLFAGDAEAVSEKEMVSNGTDIGADVLKVGHHGSSSSTTVDFLSAVNPSYAVIEVGAGNSYGHPHRETLEALKGIEVYRTDQNGTVTMVCDGVNLDVTTEK